MFHISDLKRFKRCPRLYFESLNEDTTFLPYLRNDESIHELLVKKFKIDKYFEGKIGDSPERFFENQNNYDWFIRVRFQEGELRINIPLLHKNKQEYDAYFIVYSSIVRELDLFQYRIAINLIERQGLLVNNVYIAYINPEYEYQDELDIDSLFIITDSYKDQKIIDLLNKEIIDYNQMIDQIEKTSIVDYPAKKNRFCLSQGECPYYKKCFNDLIEEDDSIIHLVSSSEKNKMYQKGIRKLKDADLSLFKVNKVQYSQIMASRNNGLFIDQSSLKEFLNRIKEKPISFVDFEWDRYLVPKYNKMKSLDVVCFEYALYVLDTNDELKHYTFVGNGDCRKEFVEGLIEHLPSTGPILAYNAEGAEILRLKELANIYPEYANQLNDICNRFVDLAEPFIEGYVYDVRMAGNFSLKKLVDICSDYSYSNMEINDGMKAVYSWRSVDKQLADDSKEIIDNLKEYCSLDAYGLFLVYKWLNNLAKECIL